jgi:hypothetical protein
MINKANYRTHRGHSAISEIEVATETTASDTVSVIGSTAVPALVGMIAPFSMETTTEWRSTNRWIICDGSPVSRTAYNHLFDVIGTTWGVGDGSSTFNLPDLQGAFLRGTGTNSFNSNTKTGPTSVGQFQDDCVQGHGHGIPNFYQDSGNNPYKTKGYGSIDYGNGNPRDLRSFESGTYGVARWDNETRVYNAGIQYCIKY